MRIVSKALREIYHWLTAALGMSTLGPPPVGPEPSLDEPPQGHPERLRPDIALTSTELALQRQLMEPIREQR
jgi:hypothetical protein